MPRIVWCQTLFAGAPLSVLLVPAVRFCAGEARFLAVSGPKHAADYFVAAPPMRARPGIAAVDRDVHLAYWEPAVLGAVKYAHTDIIAENPYVG